MRSSMKKYNLKKNKKKRKRAMKELLLSINKNKPLLGTIKKNPNNYV